MSLSLGSAEVEVWAALLDALTYDRPTRKFAMDPTFRRLGAKIILNQRNAEVRYKEGCAKKRALPP